VRELFGLLGLDVILWVRVRTMKGKRNGCVTEMMYSKLKNKGKYDATKRKRNLSQRGSKGTGRARGLKRGSKFNVGHTTRKQ
jgi:hypothetical protein